MSVVNQVRESMRSTFGLLENAFSEASLHQAVQELSERQGLRPEELADRIGAEPNLLRELTGLVTIGETHFFRHAEHFELIRDHVFEKLETVERNIVIWSAGCASGEEPYSVAMAIHAQLGELVLKRTRIFATDVDSGAIDRASQGEYTAWSFRGTPGWALTRYFELSQRSTSVLTGVIRGAVTFENSGIEQRANAIPDTSVDIVIFRNVALYLEQEALARIYQHLRRILAPDGMLMLAVTDPRPSETLFTLNPPESGSVFRPVHAAESSGAGHRSVSRAERLRQSRRVRRPVVAARPASSRSTERGLRSDAPAGVRGIRRTGVEALDFANAGELDKALRLASAMATQESTSPDAFMLRGQVLLAANRFEEAVSDFRRALYLAPEAKLARFWYALALREGHMQARAERQFEILRESLVKESPQTLLEDQATSAAELLVAIPLLSGLGK